MDLNQIWSTIGQVIIAGGVGAFFLKIFSEKWLDNQFNLRMEKFRTEQEKELANFRAKTSALFSRYSKIHEKEFEVLPEAWNKLQIVIGKLSLIVPFYAEYPDLKKSTEKEIYDILPKYGLSESEITALLRLDPDKRQQSFKDIFFWKNMNDTNDALMDFNNYILQNKIFLQTDLFQTFSIYQSKINSILTGFSIGKKDDPGFMRVPIKECRELLDEGTGELELLVQKRLHVQEASDF